ncbi:MAG TPA: CIA30 family protein, partial [Terriglobales bacterium]|nr:CIA30 family protein [Terriglobales bacterium]
AQKAIILLKNENNLLPLDLSKLKTIAVIGPNADGLHLGGYSRNPLHSVTILQGIQDRAGTKAKVVYAEGCRFTDKHQDWRGWFDDNVGLVDPKTQADKIREAVEAAKNSDVAILVVGENESSNREAWSEDHLGDRDSLDLLGAQNELVKAVVETGKPTVVFLINGRPLSINYIAEHVPAILEGWFPGQEGGTAAANILFGDVSPGGKLPITFPRSVGDLPDYYNHKPSANRTYAFSTRKPLFPFGFGLSYTTFKFENLSVEPSKIETGGTAKVSVDVINTGPREGDEVVQMYIHQRISDVTRPVKELKGFQRITLKPGEKKTVEFTLTPETLSMLDTDMHKVVEPGMFDVMVGSSSEQTTTAPLQVGGEAGAAALPAVPPSGVISNFDDLRASSVYGSWAVTSDKEAGGKSIAAMQAVEGGAKGTRGALKVTGEIIPGTDFTWAGVFFFPGSSPQEPANLSNKGTISFWARGDGKTYAVAVQTQSNAGSMPGFQPFAAGPEWKHYSFPFSAFNTDGHDVTGIAFAHAQEPGKFEFLIDELEIQ